MYLRVIVRFPPKPELILISGSLSAPGRAKRQSLTESGEKFEY
jgi:hypothetical protein